MVLLNTLLLMVLLAMVLLLFAAGILYIMSFYSCSSGGGGGGGAKLNLTEATANLIQSISVGGDNSAHISPPFLLFTFLYNIYKQYNVHLYTLYMYSTVQ